MRLSVQRGLPPAAKTEVRLTLGRWLAVALEFELAADILRTAVAPTWNEIGQLAAIAALRTALNYFLGKEIDKEASDVRRKPASPSPPRRLDSDYPAGCWRRRRLATIAAATSRPFSNAA